MNRATEIQLSWGVETDSGLEWQTLLQQYCQSFERYCRIVSNDSPCANGEISNVGILSASAWQIGWVSLIEMPQPKKHSQDGRNDLWISSSKYIWCVEAKWNHIRTNDHFVDKAFNLLKNACTCANDINYQWGVHHKVGVAFCSMQVDITHSNSIEKHIVDIVTATKQRSNDFNAMAWCFPNEIRTLKYDPDPMVYPGIIILAKLCKSDISDTIQ